MPYKCMHSFLCRVPWRLAVYYHHSKDARVVPLLQKLQTFFERQPLIYAGYELDGKPMADYSHIAFMAPVWCLFTVSLKSWQTTATLP